MDEIIANNIYMIILIPLWIFLIIMCGRFFAVYVNKKIVYLLTVFSSFLGIIFCIINLLNYIKPIEESFPVLKINDFCISFGLYADKIALISCLTLFIISFFIQIFSVSYTKSDKKNYRLFALLNFFNFSMAGLLFSQNLFQFYVFWELIGIVSYLLIGFEYDIPEKSIAAKRVFLTNRIGDTALFASIVVASYFIYNYSTQKYMSGLAFTDMDYITAILGAYLNPLYFNILCVAIVLAGVVKSAQFPFYNWLQDAMAAKLPISALLHSATLISAGFYLLYRTLPILQSEEFIKLLITHFGIATAIICSILACIETHPKKVLAYSTSANFGLIFWAVGVGNIVSAIIFFIAHALTKSMLFLCANNKSKADIVFFFAGSLSLSGIIFAGLSSKEILYLSLNNCLIFCIITFLTAFYITRLAIILLKQNKKEKFNIIELIAVLGLFITNICFYIICKKYFAYKISYPFITALSGTIFALIFRNKLEWNIKTPKLLEKIYYSYAPIIYNNIANALKFVDEKIFGNYKLQLCFAKNGVSLFNWIENNVMNKTVKYITISFKKISKYDFRLQKRNVQVYNAYALVIITIIISCLFIGYAFIINQLN